jgi:ABC-type phosphate/phosphonate transport system ATPase subunit
MLQLKNLGKRYKTGDDALKGVDLEIPDGQLVGLIGPSGAGKSTLIHCVNRLVEPQPLAQSFLLPAYLLVIYEKHAVKWR